MSTRFCQQKLRTGGDEWQFRLNEEESPNIKFRGGLVELNLSMESVAIDERVFEISFSVSAQYRVVVSDNGGRRFERVKAIDISFPRNDSSEDAQKLQVFVTKNFDIFFNKVMQASDELLLICREMRLRPENEGEGYNEERVLKSLRETNQGRPPSWGKLNGGLSLVFSHGWMILRDVEFESALDVCYEFLRNHARTFSWEYRCEPDEIVNQAILTAKRKAPWFKHRSPETSYAFFAQYLRFASLENCKQQRRLRDNECRIDSITNTAAMNEQPSENMERKELQAWVQTALNNLCPADRELAILNLVEKKSVADIAREAREAGQPRWKLYERLTLIKIELRESLLAAGYCEVKKGNSNE